MQCIDYYYYKYVTQHIHISYYLQWFISQAISVQFQELKELLSAGDQVFQNPYWLALLTWQMLAMMHSLLEWIPGAIARASERQSPETVRECKVRSICMLRVKVQELLVVMNLDSACTKLISTAPTWAMDHVPNDRVSIQTNRYSQVGDSKQVCWACILLKSPRVCLMSSPEQRAAEKAAAEWPPCASALDRWAHFGCNQAMGSSRYGIVRK